MPQRRDEMENSQHVPCLDQTLSAKPAAARSRKLSITATLLQQGAFCHLHVDQVCSLGYSDSRFRFFSLFNH